MLKKLQVLFFFGRPFGPLYGLVMKLREKLYELGFFHQNSLPVPVISVGNLVLGGTGKTPTVLHLANFFLQHGYHPAIISRGYGGKANQNVNVVSDGHSILCTPEEAGDEPFMLAEALPGVPVLTGRRRLHPCRRAIEDYNADMLILDDGFQHLSIKRDIDIVLFDGTVLIGNKRVFPGGILREPLSALQRCDAFMLTGMSENNKEQAEKFTEFLKIHCYPKPVFFASLSRLKLQSPDLPDGKAIAEGPFFAFCGIANPLRFQDSLKAMALEVSGFLVFADHIHYNQSMLTEICGQAVASGARQLVTTQKDYVKIKKLQCPLLCNFVEISLEPETAFDLFLGNSLKKLKKA